MNEPAAIEKSTQWIARHPWQVLIAAVLLTALSFIGVLNIPIFTSRKALLPQDTDVSVRLESYLEKFGAASDLIVVVEGAETGILEQFASDLAARLRQQPSIHQADERVDLMFFFTHAYLLVPQKQLAQFSSVLQKLIGIPAPKELTDWDDALERVELWLENPPPLSTVEVDLQTAEGSLQMVRFFLEEWQRWIEAEQAPSSINWQRLMSRYGVQGMASGKGYFSSRDGGMLFLFVRPMDTSEEFEVVGPFVKTVRRVAEELRAHYADMGWSVPKVGMTGLPAITHEEFATVKRDIVFTVCTAAALILLLIGLWLRSVGWAVVVFVPMGLGVLWNIGVTYIIVGHLTMITSGFTAILFGLGVDYGIFMSTRIIEEQNRGKKLIEAIARGTQASSRALLTAGGATVLIFAALGTVEFSGFAELGLVAASGVLLVLASTFILQPALFALVRPTGKVRYAKMLGQADPQAGLKFSQRANVLLVLSAGVCAFLGILAGNAMPFDYDVLELLPKESETAHYQRRMVKESDFQGEVVIFTAPSLAQARGLAKDASQLSTISKVQSMTDLFPIDAAERVQLGRQIGATVAGSAYLQKIMGLGEVHLTAEGMGRLRSSVANVRELFEDSEEMAFSAGHKQLVSIFESIHGSMESIEEHLADKSEQARQRTQDFVQSVISAARSGFKVLSTWQYATQLSPQDLPPVLRDRFFSPDGTVAIYAFPAKSVYDPENLNQLLEEVYRVSPLATGFPTTHQVFSIMVVNSFRKGTILAVVLAVLWILIVMRSGSGALIALLPLLVGGGWMMGVMAIAGMKFSYANIIGLPLVIGLAVDYGVWFAHRRRELADHSAWQVASVAGRAILLAAGTTLAGLGAITLAEYRGVASMGVSITIGLICCVVAALLISPALTQLLSRRRS